MGCLIGRLCGLLVRWSVSIGCLFQAYCVLHFEQWFYVFVVFVVLCGLICVV